MRPPTTSTAIANHIRQKIQTGEYPHNSVMPTEIELSTTFGAARNTIRKAIDSLVHEGLIQKHQGRQSRVHNPLQKQIKGTNDLAWFTYLRPEHMASNQIYFDLFMLMVERARSYGLGVQFLNPTAISDWQGMHWNSTRWAGFFAVGLSKSSIGEEVLQHLQELPHLISIDEDDDTPGFYTVTTDNFNSARIATAHLLERGCRHIAFLNTNIQQNLSFRERQRGFEYEHKKAFGSCVHPKIITLETQGKNYFECCKLFEGFIQNIGDIDGIFCASDTIAIQLMAAAQRYGVIIPEKLKIIGYDGVFAGQHVSPRLSTVAQPLKKIIDVALSLALQPDHSTPQTIKIPGRLILGETT